MRNVNEKMLEKEGFVFFSFFFFTLKGSNERAGMSGAEVKKKKRKEEDLDMERNSPPLFGFTGSFTTPAIVLMFQVISCSAIKQVGCEEVTVWMLLPRW